MSLITLLRAGKSLRHSFHLPGGYSNSMALSVVLLTIAFSQLVLSGPMIQTLVRAALMGDSAAIYTAAYGEAIVHFPSLTDWYFSAFSWIAILAGAAMALCVSGRKANPRVIFVNTTLTCFCILWVVDMVALHLQGEIAWETSVAAALFDFVGSAALAAGAVLVTSWANRVPAIFRMRGVGAVFTAGFAAIAIGGFGSILAYYTCDFFLRPLPVAVDMRVMPGARGVTAFSNDVTEDEAFKVIPSVINPETVRWAEPEGSLTAEWSATSDKVKFDVSVDLFSGCTDQASLGAKRSSKSFRLTDVRSLKAKFDKGTHFASLYGAGQSGSLGLTRGSAAPYGTDRDAETNTNSIWEFVADATLAYEGRDDLTFSLSSYTIDHTDEDTVRPQSVTLRLEANGKPYDVALDAPDGFTDAKLSCKALPTSNAFRRGTLALDRIVAGVRISIVARPTPVIFRTSTSVLKFSGTSGWVTLDDIPDDPLERHKGGRLDVIHVAGEADLIVGGVRDPEPRASDEYIVLGALSASYEKGGVIRVVGSASELMKNGTRRNPTKFEGASGSLTAFFGSLIFGGGFPIALVFLFGRLMLSNTPLLRDDD